MACLAEIASQVKHSTFRRVCHALLGLYRDVNRTPEYVLLFQ